MTPGPGDLINEFGEEKSPYDDADSFIKQMRRDIAEKKKNLPPSERERVDASFDVEGEIGGDEDERLLIETYDLLEEADRYRFEAFVQQEQVRPINSSWKWADDNQQLVYFVMYHVSPQIYQEKRQEYISPQPKAGPMERLGRTLDGWGRQVKEALS